MRTNNTYTHKLYTIDMYTHTHTNTHTHTFTHIHSHTHTHTLTYIYIFLCSDDVVEANDVSVLSAG
jgi:hypothetical protein